MKKFLMLVWIAALLIAVSQIDSRPTSAADCKKCACANVTGVLVADNSGSNTFSHAFYYYEINEDGSSGNPVECAAVTLYYSGNVTCTAVAMSNVTATDINQIMIKPPPAAPCTPATGVTLNVGDNLYLAAPNSAPDGLTPMKRKQNLCKTATE